MTGYLRRHPIVSSIVLVAVAAGCGDTGCGCGEQPLEAALPQEHLVHDGIIAELTPDGFDFIEQNFASILTTFLPDGLTFELPAAGSTSCKDLGCSGQLICKGNAPCPVAATLHSVGLSTLAPDKLHLQARLDLSSGDIPLEFCQDLWLTCVHPDCDIRLTVQNKPVSADVVFGRDPLTEATTFEVRNVAVSLKGDDFRVDGGWACDVSDWGFVRGWIADFANKELKKQIPAMVKEQVDAQTCMPCDFYTSGCAGAGGGASCDAATGWCMDPWTSACVHKPMGLVGRVDAGQMLSSMASLDMPSAFLDVSVGLGQARAPALDPIVPFDGGPVDLRMVSGIRGVQSPCVPPAASEPDVSAPPRIDFANARISTPFMLGVGISDRFLDKAFYEAWRAGALCLELGSETVSIISTQVFQSFLPSLRSLTEGRNAPMIISLRPKDRPLVDVGRGTWHLENGKKVLDEPLLTIHLPATDLDIYALIEERYVRLFTLTADIQLPLAFELTPQNELVPILGDLGSLVTNIHASNSEILAEDPAVLVDLIPTVLALAEPMLAGALQPISLPEIQGFALEVTKLEGMVPAAAPGTYEHLGLLANLQLAAPPPMPLRAQTKAELLEVRLPPPETLVLEAGRPLPSPTAVVAVEAWDARRESPGLEWHYRLDGGFWSPFRQGPRLELASPLLLAQGRHLLEVRSRTLGEYRTLDPTPAQVEILVDWEPPVARLTFEGATGLARVEARDAISPSGALRYAFSFDGGPFTAFSPEPERLTPVQVRQIVARVRDEAGNEATLRWGGLPAAVAEASGGCAAASGGAAGALWLFLLAGLFRRRR